MSAEYSKTLTKNAVSELMTATSRARSRQRRWQIERHKRGLCTKCGKPAVIYAKGKRTGQASVYCEYHLTEQRERHRAKQYTGEMHFGTNHEWKTELPVGG